MSKHYKDYFWKNGIPQGISSLKNKELTGNTYKITADPYYKRISIEKYFNGDFQNTIYDTALFDFRHLKQAEQQAWQKTLVNETVCHIRNQDDRLILIENYFFENQLCRECRMFSPFGPLLARQKIFYKIFEDPFDGVVLYDGNEHPVIHKYYQVDPLSQEFRELLEENWKPDPFPI